LPDDFRDRAKRWRASAASFVSETLSFVPTSIENLMFAERPILLMENALAHRDDGKARPAPDPFLIMQCSALSALWLLGLYEAIRVLKETDAPTFSALRNLFIKLEIVRMPLAKHEVKSARNYRKVLHFPTGAWDQATGCVGWSVFNPNTDQTEIHSRTDLANEFLEITVPDPMPESPAFLWE